MLFFLARGGPCVFIISSQLFHLAELFQGITTLAKLMSLLFLFVSSSVEHNGSTDRVRPSVDPTFSSPPSDPAVLHVDLPALVLHHWC